MKVTIVYDNTVFEGKLQSDWGFSAVVEAGAATILFDTGAQGSILLDNMRGLGIAPKQIDDVFISHAHSDHTGGLAAFLHENGDVRVWVPPSFREVENAREVIVVNGPTTLYEGIHSTGELEGIEQSLCLATDKGIVVIAGCSHPKMSHILRAAGRFGRVYGIIGGFHANEPESLGNLHLICATHCTQYIDRIRSMYPEQYVEGGAGKVLQL